MLLLLFLIDVQFNFREILGSSNRTSNFMHTYDFLHIFNSVINNKLHIFNGYGKIC